MPANVALGARSFALVQSLTVAAALSAMLPPVVHSPGAPLSLSALVGQLALATIAVAGGVIAIGSYRLVRRELSVRTRGEATARAESLTDELTGALNRRGFRALAEHQIRVARRNGSDLLLLYVDLIDFKGINDRYGHAEGDRALREVAALLQRTVRDTDLVARMGGDEFALLMIAGTPEAERAVRARLDGALAAYNGVPGQSFPIALTMGSARLSAHPGAELDDLLRSADSALYRRRGTRPLRPSGEWSPIASAA
jgi:diguanylate cyclase (GGDEF)-like protein